MEHVIFVLLSIGKAKQCRLFRLCDLMRDDDGDGDGFLLRFNC